MYTLMYVHIHSFTFEAREPHACPSWPGLRAFPGRALSPTRAVCMLPRILYHVVPPQRHVFIIWLCRHRSHLEVRDCSFHLLL